jgi:hypothetical protein
MHSCAKVAVSVADSVSFLLPAVALGCFACCLERGSISVCTQMHVPGQDHSN